jgi:hypothetical protein
VIAGISAAYERYGLRMIWRDEAAIKDLLTGGVTLLPPPGTAAGGLGDPRLWLPSPVHQDSPVSLRAGIGTVARRSRRGGG